MKQLFTLAAFFLISTYCCGQPNLTNEFNKEEIKITRHSMVILGAWGAVNLLYSGIATGSSTGSNTYFHRMNLIWGGVNFTIGTLGFFFTKNRGGLGYSQVMKKQMAIEKVYLFNAGLDLAYVVGGFYFKERANNTSLKYDRYRGYGKSIIIQGAALFLFDGIMYLIHQKHGKKLYRLADNIQAGLILN